MSHGETVVDIWRELPLDGTGRMRWWRVPAAEVPRGTDAQVEWLYHWWARIDAWGDDIRRRPGGRPPGRQPPPHSQR